MARKIFFLIFLLFLIQGCDARNQDGQTAQSEITDPYSWDFGQVEAGKVLKHNFVFKNESKKTLSIKELNSSCGCTVSKVKKKILLSGESTLIEAKFNTKGYLGQTQQFIYVHTDSLDNPIVRFIIKATVVNNKGG